MFPVFLVDDVDLVRLGVGFLLSVEGRFRIVGQTGSAAQAVDMIARTHPALVILDSNLPDGSGIDLCRTLRSSPLRPRCIVLSEDDSAQTRTAANLAGASAYVLKKTHREQLLDAAIRVAEGERLMGPALRADAWPAGRDGRSGDAPHPALSPREVQVLHLLASGMTNREIGGVLHLTEKTVKNYVSGLLAKMGFERRTQAAVYAATHAPQTNPDGSTSG